MKDLLAWFGFKRFPFDKNIKPQDVLETEPLKEALARLDYIKIRRGIILLTGDPGVGKTLALRSSAMVVAHHSRRMSNLCKLQKKNSLKMRQRSHAPKLAPTSTAPTAAHVTLVMLSTVVAAEATWRKQKLEKVAVWLGHTVIALRRM